MKNSEIDIYNEAALNTLSQMIKAMIAEKNYCKMVEEHNCEMNNRKSISKYDFLEYLPFKIQWKLKNEFDTHSNNKNTIVLDINTSERLRGKAYKFMNTFIKCTSKMGGDVYVDRSENNDNTMFTLLESRYKCRLFEKQAKLRNKINLENRKMTPLYELEYTGDLYFEILEKNRDNNIKESWGLLHTIEINNSDNNVSKLVELLYKLRDDAISKKAIIDKEKIKKDEEWKKQIKKWEEDRIREEQAKIKKEELLKKQKTEEKIRTHLDKWEYINKTLLYVNELRSISDASDEEKELILKYCDYVEKFYNKSEFYKEITGFYKELEGREEIK